MTSQQLYHLLKSSGEENSSYLTADMSQTVCLGGEKIIFGF